MKLKILIIFILVCLLGLFILSKNGDELASYSLSDVYSETEAGFDSPEEVIEYFEERTVLNQTDPKAVVGQSVGLVMHSFPDYFGRYIGALKEETGKVPGIMSLAYSQDKRLVKDYSEINTILEAHSDAGGIVSLILELGNPWLNEGLKDLGTGEYEFDSLFEEGSAPNIQFRSQLASIAFGLKDLEDRNVQVMLRPFHEMNGDWFWWSYDAKGKLTNSVEGRISPANFIELWKYTYEYFESENNLQNLVWVYSPNAQMNNDKIMEPTIYYPGEAYVDIIGLDYYSDTLEQLTATDDIERLLEFGKPFGMSEIGSQSREGFDSVEVFDELISTYPEITFLVFWNGWDLVGGVLRENKAIIENQSAYALMNHDQIITIDEIR